MVKQIVKILNFPKEVRDGVVATGTSVSFGSIAGLLTYQLAAPVFQSFASLIILTILTGVSVTLIILIVFLLRESNRNNNILIKISEDLHQKTELSEVLAKQLTDSKLCNLVKPELTLDSFEMYLTYKKLRADQFSNILYRLDRLYRGFYALKTDLIFKNGKSEVSDYTDLICQTESLLKNRPEDRLYISFAQTGDSIRFHIKTGWSPSFDITDGDFNVGLPKCVLVTGISILLINTAYQAGISNINDTLDFAIKRQEIELNQENLEIKRLNKKKLQLETEKLMYELKQTRSKLRESPKHLRTFIEDEFREFVKSTLYNEEISSIKITSGFSLNKTLERDREMARPF